MPMGNGAVSGSSKAAAIVWIEDRASRISRGEAESVTAEGLRVRLAEPPGFTQGDEVNVRIARERGAPTLATTARVTQIQAGAAGVECSLVWSAPRGERRELDAWLAKAA